MASTLTYSADPKVYSVVKEIGKGRSSVVYKVKDAAGNEYAVKQVNIAQLEMDADPENKPKVREIALNEAQLMTSLESHPNIVRVYDYYIENDAMSIAMELCNEGTLGDALLQEKQLSEWFEEALLVSWFIQLISVIKYLHNKKILHRDIKPNNIFLASGGAMVKIGDLGITKALSSSLTNAEAAPYIPPETNALNERIYSFKSEVWNLGMVMYELLAQELPFSVQAVGGAAAAIYPVPPLPTERYTADLRNFVAQRMLCNNQHDRTTVEEIFSQSFVLEGISRMAAAQCHSGPRKFGVSSIERSIGRSPLHEAAFEGDIDLCEKLMNRNSTYLFSKSNIEDENEALPIHLAAFKGHLSVVKLFVAANADLERQKNKWGNMPIHCGAIGGRAAIVEYFMEARHQSVEIRGELGRTVLHMAARNGYIDLCENLVSQHRADTFAKSNKDSLPIHLAAYKGHLSIVQFFVRAKPDLERMRNGTGDLPIHCAAIGGRVDVVEFFLTRRRQPVDLRGQAGRTLLHLAAGNGHVEVCEKLVNQHAADMFIASGKCDNKNLPIHPAAYRGHLSVVVFFAKKNKRIVTVKNMKRQLPLDVARVGFAAGVEMAEDVVAFLKSQ